MCAAHTNQGDPAFAQSLYSDSCAVSVGHNNANRGPNWRGAFDSSSKRRAHLSRLRISTNPLT